MFFRLVFSTILICLASSVNAEEKRPTGIADIDRYEFEMRYITGHARERFPDDMFLDIPVGGFDSPKLRFAYFGTRSIALEEQSDELVEIMWYSWDSPEGEHARRFGVKALGVDGLGRKVTRYAMDLHAALNSFKNGELDLLKRYLAAKKEQ